MQSTNLERLIYVARGLGTLVEHVFFVGGSVVELYVQDAGITPVRPTEDVDFVLELTKGRDMRDWELLLSQQGFRHDMTPGAPICRWLFGEAKVDIMSADAKSLGFTNRWYAPAMREPKLYQMDSNLAIKLFPLTYFIATKLEATFSRGWPDLRMSHDFEDIVYLWDGVEDIRTAWADAETELQNYMKSAMDKVKSNATFREAVEAHMPIGSGKRVQKVIQEMIALTVP